METGDVRKGPPVPSRPRWRRRLILGAVLLLALAPVFCGWRSQYCARCGKTRWGFCVFPLAWREPRFALWNSGSDESPLSQLLAGILPESERRHQWITFSADTMALSCGSRGHGWHRQKQRLLAGGDGVGIFLPVVLERDRDLGIAIVKRLLDPSLTGSSYAAEVERLHQAALLLVTSSAEAMAQARSLFGLPPR